MQRNYSTFVMLRQAISLSTFLVLSSSTSKFSSFPLMISLISRLAFLLLFVFSRILFKRLTMMKEPYPPTHTKQLVHPFPLTLTVTTMTVALQRMIMRNIQKLNYKVLNIFHILIHIYRTSLITSCVHSL